MGYFGKVTAALFAMVLAFASLQAQAATKAQDREFNHMTTGYPLTGVHSTVACESCHVGGVFVGTPRACDGCHATGKRVVATPKSLKHIVTDAPCETCHFNTSTFFGARYNHGTAVPGQCDHCHNGRITQGKPSVHPATLSPCDNCHRSSSWLPASWNHRDTASDCSECHYNHTLGNGRTPSASHLPMSMPPAPSFAANCKACHTNYYTFLSAFYNHSGAGTACQNCHGGTGGTTYTGVVAAKTTGTQIVHNAIGGAPFPGGTTCQSCHTSYASFAGARYNHAGATDCASCHDTASPTYGGYVQVASTPRHTVYAGVGITLCSKCHTSTATWSGARYSHGAGDTNCVACHTDANKPYIPSSMSVPPHIPILGGATCINCHNTSGTTWSMAVTSVQLHNYVDVTTCTTCHLTGNPYSGNRQETKKIGHEGMRAGDDCSKSGCHKPLGSRGVTYQRWD